MILFFTVNWQAPWRRADYVVLQPIEAGDSLVFVPGTRELRAKGPTIVSSRREPTPPPAAPPPAVTPPVDTGVTLPAYDPNASRVAPAPRVGDGRLWVSPRPGLPAAIADAIYGDTAGRRQGAIDRLRVMVDSLNQVLDQMHVAGVKIPTMVLALLGNLLPQGNFDEAMRARQLNDMRADLLRAADRAQTLQQFRRYVRELRERKQAERDAEQRRRAQDTVRAVP